MFKDGRARQKINIVGGGVCALILGCTLDPEKYEVAVYEKNAALGRKFLVAGEGGLNLTHSEPESDFIHKYTPFEFLQTAFHQFSNLGFIRWINDLGIETYVGSSGRMFPKKGIKPIEVLNILLEKMKTNGVAFHTKQEWKGFSKDHHLVFQGQGGQKEVEGNLVVFCLGGASWPVTGSAGTWVSFFEKRGLRVLPFQASNCSFTFAWPVELIPIIEGKALKNCSIRCGTFSHKGEVVLTATGIEGSGIYPLSPHIREQLHRSGQAEIFIDMKPALSKEALLSKRGRTDRKTSYTNQISQQFNLNRTQLALLKQFVSKSDFLDPAKLVDQVKNFRLIITGTGAVEKAISTVGGLALQELDKHFELKKLPSHFALGEMLDFDAPTGGYLLQACFSMSNYLASYLNHL